MKTEILVLTPTPTVIIGRRKTLKVMMEEGELITSPHIPQEYLDELRLVYIFSVRQLNSEHRTLIKSLVRRGVNVMVEFMPRSRNDVEVMNKFTSSYGIEYTWIKVVDYKYNVGLYECPMILIKEAKHDILKNVGKVVFHRPYHIRAEKSQPLIIGNESCIALDPITNKPLVMPRGHAITLAALHTTQKNSVVIAFSGYVFDDTALENKGNEVLLRNIIRFCLR